MYLSPELCWKIIMWLLIALNKDKDKEVHHWHYFNRHTISVEVLH